MALDRQPGDYVVAIDADAPGANERWQTTADNDEALRDEIRSKTEHFLTTLP